jgi:hypothetical protein
LKPLDAPHLDEVLRETEHPDSPDVQRETSAKRYNWGLGLLVLVAVYFGYFGLWLLSPGPLFDPSPLQQVFQQITGKAKSNSSSSSLAPLADVTECRGELGRTEDKKPPKRNLLKSKLDFRTWHPSKIAVLWLIDFSLLPMLWEPCRSYSLFGATYSRCFHTEEVLLWLALSVPLIIVTWMWAGYRERS